MRVLGLYNRSTGCLEGADDLGRVFVRRLGNRALASALSLIQLHLQGCDSFSEGCGSFFIMFPTLFAGVGMIWFFNWLSRTSESFPEGDVPVMEEPATSHIEDEMITMSQIGAAIFAANAEFSPSSAAASSSSVPTGLAGTDPIEMPALSDESDFPELHAAWSLEAMLAFMYSRCLRRRAAATTTGRRQLYEERLQLLCNVMDACRSGDQSVRLAAAERTRTMSDLSDDENSPNSHLSWAGFCNTMDEVEHAVGVGQRTADRW